MLESYLGIDVGSVTTKFAVLDDRKRLISSVYLRTQGNPVFMIQEGLRQIRRSLPQNAIIRGVGTTGSARHLAEVIVGADVVKNEITSQAVATLQYIPDVQTIIEIGGQDSKITILRQGMAVDFAMNTICAAGTGSFLDHQALRLNIPIEEFGLRALQSNNPVRISGRCTVFAESDMIHKQHVGHSAEDIIYGLCRTLVKNYLNNLSFGKEILPPVVFQGGVAFNQGIVRALNETLDTNVIVPPHHEVMGAIGAATLASEEIIISGSKTRFKGFEITEKSYQTSSFECANCPNICEIVQISLNDTIIAHSGNRCELWHRPSNN